MKKVYDWVCIGMALSLTLAVVGVLVYFAVYHWKYAVEMVGAWCVMMGAMRGVFLIGAWSEKRKAAGK
jgi:hypothetical protein